MQNVTLHQLIPLRSHSHFKEPNNGHCTFHSIHSSTYSFHCTLTWQIIKKNYHNDKFYKLFFYSRDGGADGGDAGGNMATGTSYSHCGVPRNSAASSSAGAGTAYSTSGSSCRRGNPSNHSYRSPARLHPMMSSKDASASSLLPRLIQNPNPDPLQGLAISNRRKWHWTANHPGTGSTPRSPTPPPVDKQDQERKPKLIKFNLIKNLEIDQEGVFFTFSFSASSAKWRLGSAIKVSSNGNDNGKLWMCSPGTDNKSSVLTMHVSLNMAGLPCYSLLLLQGIEWMNGTENQLTHTASTFWSIRFA